MTCMNEKHWDDYNPNCNPCQNEMRTYVRDGRLSQKDYDRWRIGRLKFPIRKITREFVKV